MPAEGIIAIEIINIFTQMHMRKMRKQLYLAMALMATMATGSLTLACASSDEEPDSPDEVKHVANMLSSTTPIQLTGQQRVFAEDNNTFSLNFLRTVNEQEADGKSFIYSPLSITYVLAMVDNAAAGQTEKELEQTLGFHEGGIQAVNDYCKKLIDNLPKVDEKVNLNIANAIYVNNRYQLNPQFVEDMKHYYDAKAEALNFSDSKKSADIINKWCDEKTNGMIPDIIDATDPDMITYLLNAIYFKADWASKFDPKNTKTEPFTTEKGETRLPLMHQTVLINYMKNAVCSAVVIPYGAGLWNMTVYLPEEGTTVDDMVGFLTTDPAINSQGVSQADFEPYEVDLKLPRYETSSDTDELQDGLIGLMSELGIHHAFDRDLSEIPNMCDGNLFISMMRQKAKIKVNEEGSEAAAVTIAGVELNSVAAPPTYPKATFHANRPFVYVISEASSGVILFVGKYTGQ